MFLQNLLKLRERLTPADVPPAYYKEQAIKYALKIDKDGQFLGWITLGDSKKGQPEKAPYSIRSGARPAPQLIADKHTYLLGTNLDPKIQAATEKAAEKAATKAQNSHEDYIALLQSCMEWPELNEDEQRKLQLVHDFVTGAEKNKAIQQAPTELKESELVTFSIDNEFIHSLEGLQSFWARYQLEQAASKSKLKGECLLTGEEQPLAATHPIELLIGPNRTQLISANENAFESYGLKKAAVAPIGFQAALRYGEALRFLLNADKHHVRIGDTTLVYWTREAFDFDPVNILTDPDAKEVKDFLEKTFKKGGEYKNTLEDNQFYAVSLSANTSRLVIRSSIETTLGNFIARLKQWHDELAIIESDGSPSTPIPLMTLALSTVREYKDLKADFPAQLLDCVLHGTSLPRQVMERVIRRIRVDVQRRITRPRVALLKYCYNGLQNEETKKVTAELSQDNHEPAYLCGRLFAVLEHAQKLTIGESGKAGKEDKKSFAGISSRFFGTASSAPGTVFPQLMKLYRNHHKKLERDNPKAAYGIDEEITSIVENISTDGFPGILSLEKQGLFHIGYYHQKAAERRARREAKERKAKTKEAQEATSKNEKEGQ